MVLEQKSLCRFFTLLVFDQMPGTSSLRNTQLLHIIAWLIFAAIGIGIALSGLQEGFTVFWKGFSDNV